MTRRWECDGIFVNLNARVVKVIQYGSENEGIPHLLENQRTGEVFVAEDFYDSTVGGDFNEMQILALIASDDPIKL